MDKLELSQILRERGVVNTYRLIESELSMKAGNGRQNHARDVTRQFFTSMGEWYKGEGKQYEHETFEQLFNRNSGAYEIALPTILDSVNTFGIKV